MFCGPIFYTFDRDFLALKLVVGPYSERIEPALLGMSLTTLGEVPRSVSRFLESFEDPEIYACKVEFQPFNRSYSKADVFELF